MRRSAPIILGLMMSIAGICHGQSLADAARENRKQKKDGDTTPKVITSDDFSSAPDVTIHMVPGTTST